MDLRMNTQEVFKRRAYHLGRKSAAAIAVESAIAGARKEGCRSGVSSLQRCGELMTNGVC